MADVAAFLNDMVVIVAERLNAITPPGRTNRRWRPVSRCENWFHIVITTVCQAVRGTRVRSSAVDWTVHGNWIVPVERDSVVPQFTGEECMTRRQPSLAALVLCARWRLAPSRSTET